MGERRKTTRIIGKSYSEPICKNAKLTTFNKRADPLFQHVTPEDSGKYVVKLSCPHRAIYSFEVIVQFNPLLFIDCQDTVAYEGENISCICKATNMNSSTSVTWIRNKTEQSRGGWNKEMEPAHVCDLPESGNARCPELSKFRKKNQNRYR